MGRESFRKRITAVFWAAVLLVAIAALSLSGGGYARAQAADAFYHAFSGVSALYADESGYVVADRDGITILDLDGTVSGSASLTGVTGFAEVSGELLAANGTATRIGRTDGSVGGEFGAADFVAATETNVYCAVGDEIVEYSLEGAETTRYAISATASGLTTANGKVYYSVVRGAYADVYEVGASEAAYSGLRSDGVIFGGESGLYAILRTGQVAKINLNGAEVISGEGRFAVAGCEFGGGVVYATDRGELRRLGGDGDSLIAASDSDSIGFYSQPSGAVARFGMRLVCDYLNNRVEIMVEGDTSYLALPRPYSAAIDDEGKIYIAHSGNKVAIFGQDREIIETVEFAETVTAVVAHYGTAVALSGKRIVTIGEKTEIVSDADGLSSSGVAAYSKGADVFSLDGGAMFSAEGEIISLAFDEGGNAFMIVKTATGAKPVKRTADGTASDLEFTVGERAFLTVAKAAVGGDYGDLIVVDTDACRVFGFDGGAVMNGGGEAVSEPYDEENIVYSLRNACRVYTGASEEESAFSLRSGARVIVAKLDVGVEGFSFVAVEDGEELKTGFILTANLGERVGYADPPATLGTVYLAGASLYALPSIYAQKTAVTKDSKVTLLPFCEYGNGGLLWYRVRLADGTHGYMTSGSVSVRSFSPDGARPQYNAVVRAVGDSVAAKVYENTGGEMVEIENSLLVEGTKIEVVGTFDPSLKYTRIRYYDEELGTCECYILTPYVDYNGVSLARIIAVVIIVATVILLSVLLIVFYSRKKKI